MSDDLVKRLRQGGTYQHDTVPMHKAADRIEQVEAELIRTHKLMMKDAKRLEQLEELQADEANIAFQMGAEWQKKCSETAWKGIHEGAVLALQARIEQLEAALQKINDYPMAYDARQILIKALEKKNE